MRVGNSFGLGAAVALMLGAMALHEVNLADERGPIRTPPRSRVKRRRKIKDLPHARKRDWKFEARVAATNAVQHPRHVHPRHRRKTVDGFSLARWEAAVQEAAAAYKGSKL